MNPGYPETAVSVSGLRKAFQGRLVVKDVALDVPRGRIFGLVGPDGAGKTTTFRLMCGILRPDGGAIRIAGHSVTDAPEEVKRRIGYLSQTFSQYPDLTVWENLAFTAALYEVPDGEWQERATELLGASRMLPFKNRLAGRLSGGMKQKLALSCTLLHTPDVVFLDEPTTGVDPVSRRDFWSILYDLPTQGVTIVVSTPFMDEAARCSLLAFMFDGAIIASGSPQELRKGAGGGILVLEVERPREARDVLASRRDVRTCILFGDRLHVMLEDGETTAQGIRRALEEAGIAVYRLEEAEAGLEDVFVRLTQDAAGGAK